MKYLFTLFLALNALASICLMADIEVMTPEAKVTEQSNTFALELYGRLFDQTKNICFSPFSISTAFAMVANGAEEGTRDEISRAFHFGDDLSVINQGYAALTHHFSYHPSNVPNDLRVALANSLWLQPNLKLEPPFVDALNKYYQASLKQTDFARQTEASRKQINSWVKEKTFGKISDLIPPNVISSGTRLVLVSALFLKARWATPFDEALTKPASFYGPGHASEIVPMMTVKAAVPYLEQDDFQMVVLPYTKAMDFGPKLALAVFLPKEEQDLSRLQRLITPARLKDWLSQAQAQSVEIVFPKVKIEETLNLKDALQKLGVTAAFGPEADFSGINGNRDLQIDDALHKTILEIDEKGTEAAAATAVAIGLKSIFQPELPVLFRADHPFIYALMDQATGTVLFFGHIVHPQGQL